MVITLLVLYVIFALATAIVSYVYLFKPAMEQLELLNPHSPFITKKSLNIQILLVLEILAFFIAPVMFVIYLNKAYTQKFIEHFALDMSKH